MNTLETGHKAPSFKGTDQNGNLISLDALKGKKVVLYFYPKDNTPGCTAEACNLKDHHDEFNKKGYVIIGVSPDSAESHTKFASKYELPFSLIPDKDKTILNAYGAWGTKNMCGKITEGVLRTTFVIDENGIIEKIIRKVDTKNHHTQLL